MIEHHEGAIVMAQTEQEEGEYPDAIVLAEDRNGADRRDLHDERAPRLLTLLDPLVAGGHPALPATGSGAEA
ncbi:DUF305 domain-containing protein [Nocardioides sp.]|uniref:DUF305 domain-containing protein n=1 Tax=Nocardioides sp. TaxID=35761 RepID=UPI00273428BB|nr:DUF305 domain-containing protein [Nocardioides sp.]MDP3893699.1 DUF305 domain-containing protein [Nocardioides sp.]